jgi:hypothetical protein
MSANLARFPPTYAAPPRISRQSRHARRRVDHHVPRAPDAGGQSSRSPSATERTDRPRASRPENPPPKSAHARLQDPSAHGKIATILLQETARPGKRRLSWLIRSRNALLRMSAKAAAEVRFQDADCLESEFRKMTPGRSHYWSPNRPGSPATRTMARCSSLARTSKHSCREILFPPSNTREVLIRRRDLSRPYPALPDASQPPVSEAFGATGTSAGRIQSVNMDL